MKNGLARFEYHLTQVETLLAKAATQKNPALWLYKNNLRTPFFMLEALSKLYACIHNKKKFTKLNEHFKLIEDTLGAIDYYDAFANEFKANKKIPAEITGYLSAQTREKIQSLNELLVEKGWLENDKKRIPKIREKLAEADWLNAKDDVKEINEFYGEAIYKIEEFTTSKDFNFNNVESDVHELRRKLRWLSIYPQALRGCIQLAQSKATASLKKYLTKEIVNSPFNKLPDAGDNEVFLLLDQNHFFALSWMIAELGKLKDSGLRIIAIKEALQQSSTTLPDAVALKQAYKFTGAKQPQLPAILQQADKITKTYFAEKNLEYLVKGIATTKK
jgi:polyhydroxyalkanoate synthesis regulator phasin